jgi:predicted phage baseplate assembly protein
MTANATSGTVCGCCGGAVHTVPVAVENRPALTAIAYRIGTQPSFRQAMLSRLGRVPGLGTRRDDDFSIALLDAWATVSDVLTFYQERIANESFLRTATERRSLLELSRLIDYRPRPGVAASAYVAFAMEDAPGAPDSAAPAVGIPAGLKVQSLPAPGERPVVFETAETIEARPEWNAIRARRLQPQALSTAATTVILQGVGLNVRPGDSVLLVADDRVVKRAVRVTQDDVARTTRVDLVADPPDPPRFVFPDLLPGVFLVDRLELDDDAVGGGIVSRVWKQHDLSSVARVQRWPIRFLQRAIRKRAAHRDLPPDSGVFVFRQHAAVFGHNAPKYLSLPAEQRADGGAYPKSWEGRTLADESDERQLDLDRTYPGVIPGSFVVLETETARRVYRVEDNAELSRGDFTLSAKVTRLRLEGDDGFSEFTLRGTSVLAQSEKLALADLPIAEAVQGSTLVLDGAYLELSIGRTVALTGERADLQGVTDSEVLTIADVALVGGYTTLTFVRAMAHSYARDTVTLNANVALATHGETVREVAGSGDATVPYQRMTLRQSPLTYVSSDTPTGALSTLDVRVDGLRWQEVPNFHGRAPGERVFVTRTDDDGATTVIFGNGTEGARLSTGRENVVATYRKGAGSAGNLAAQRLGLLPARPPGVRAVGNPLPAGGGTDPETLDDVRRNAPLTVMTLDRIVSLQDYEDFARAFAGVSKALATWTWSGRARVVFVTVAGTAGADIPGDSPIHANLLTAMRKAGDPHVVLRVESYREAFFRLAAKVWIDPARSRPEVLAGVEARLRSTFSFDARAFGQPVYRSEVVAAIQNVPGVVAAEIGQFARTDTLQFLDFAVRSGLDPAAAFDRPRERPLVLPPDLHRGARTDAGDTLLAAVPQAGDDASIAPAELLTLDPRPLDLVGVTP